MVSEKKRATNAKWDKENAKTYAIKCMVKTDKDIIDFLATLDNKNIFFKTLIRQYMEAQKKDL